MNNSIKRWLDRLPIDDPLQRRQASLFQLALIAWVGLVVLGFALFNINGPPDMPATVTPGFMEALWLLFTALLLMLIMPIVALVMLRRGHLAAAVGTTAYGLLAVHSLAVFVLGFHDPSAMAVFQLPIVLLGLLGGRRQLWVAVVLSIVVVIMVAWLESLTPPLAGWFTRPGDPPLSFNVPIGQAVGFFVVVTLLIGLLLDRFSSALREALAGSLEREGELRGIRASLETSVAARTAELESALSDVQAQAAEQRRLLAEVEQQRATIQDLSVPVIPISADTLVMPLVGSLDSARLQQLQEQSLRALERSSARTLVLDITGVPVVDSQVAQGLLLTVRSARLIGAEVALVGIRPEVAQTIVGLGIDLRDVRTFSDLHSALEHATV